MNPNRLTHERARRMSISAELPLLDQSGDADLLGADLTGCPGAFPCHWLALLAHEGHGSITGMGPRAISTAVPRMAHVVARVARSACLIDPRSGRATVLPVRVESLSPTVLQRQRYPERSLGSGRPLRVVQH